MIPDRKWYFNMKCKCAGDFGSAQQFIVMSETVSAYFWFASALEINALKMYLAGVRKMIPLLSMSQMSTGSPTPSSKNHTPFWSWVWTEGMLFMTVTLEDG